VGGGFQQVGHRPGEILLLAVHVMVACIKRIERIERIELITQRKKRQPKL